MKENHFYQYVKGWKTQKLYKIIYQGIILSIKQAK